MLGETQHFVRFFRENQTTKCFILPRTTIEETQQEKYKRWKKVNLRVWIGEYESRSRVHGERRVWLNWWRQIDADWWVRLRFPSKSRWSSEGLNSIFHLLLFASSFLLLLLTSIAMILLVLCWDDVVVVFETETRYVCDDEKNRGYLRILEQTRRKIGNGFVMRRLRGFRIWVWIGKSWWLTASGDLTLTGEGLFPVEGGFFLFYYLIFKR